MLGSAIIGSTKQSSCQLYFRVSFIYLLLLSLFSCQQFRMEQVQDYSMMLPQDQLLYFSLTVQTKAQQVGFPYSEMQAKFLENKQLKKFVAKRLQRSQAALGHQGQVYAVNQLQLNSTLFAKQMRKQASWKQLDLGTASFLRIDQVQALEMPMDNVLYLSQGAGASTDLFKFHKLWLSGSSENSTQALFAKFRKIQWEEPLVVYGPRLREVIVSPMLQNAFPQVLGSFAKVSQQFPIRQILAWIEVRKAGSAPFALHLELATGSLLLSKGLAAGFRLFLPSMILRSQQEFIRRQLPNLVLEADDTLLRLEIPLDRESLRGILDQLKFLPI